MKVNSGNSHSSDSKKNQTIAVIRIHGQAKIKTKVAETLNRLRLRRKLACILVDEKDKVKMGMVLAVGDYVSYGKIDDKMIEELKKKRGQKDAKTGKLKPFFRLHPPIGGFKKSTRLSFSSGNGVLGKWKDNELGKLLGRML